MEAPAKIQPRTPADYLDVMSKAVFQTGISWQVVDKKWPEIRAAFRGFDPEVVAYLSPDDVDALCADRRVIRNRRKIEAIVSNAARMVELADEHGGFPAYLRSHGDFDATVKDLRKRFKFLGELDAYYFLWVVNEPVPSFEEWSASRGRSHMGEGAGVSPSAGG